MTIENPAGEYHAVHYSDASFRGKLRRYSRRLGRGLVQKALELYYVLESPDLPPRVKWTILGALGYLILPLDAIPDILPGAGYTDDLGTIIAALGIAAAHLTPEIKLKAAMAVSRIFGEERGAPSVMENGE